MPGIAKTNKKQLAYRLIFGQKHTDTQIASLSGLSQPSVSAMRKAHNLPPVKRDLKLRVKEKKGQQLTDKTTELLDGLLKRGNFSQNRIARRLHIHPSTANAHAKNIAEKNPGIQSRGKGISGLKEKRIISLLEQRKTNEQIRDMEQNVGKKGLAKIRRKLRPK